MTPDVIADQIAEPIKQAPSTAGMTTKVVKGSLWTLAGQVAPLAVSLVTTPFVIRMLGAEGYGVLILVGLIPAYLGFADFGMSMASTKFASEAYAEGDLEKEARIVRTAALIALCSSLPFGTALFVLSGWLVTLFNVPEALQPEASLALKIASVTFVVNFLNGIFNTPQLTRLRMDLNSFITSGLRILGLIATPVVLYLGFGVVGAVLVLLLTSLFTLLGHVVISARLDPNLFGLSIDPASVRTVLSFGGGLVIGNLAGILLANLEKGLLSVAANVTALAYYSVAFTFAGMMTMFSSALVQSLLPAFSQLQGPETREQLDALYNRGIRLNIIWLLPMLVFLVIIAKPFFSLWAGPEYGVESLWPFYILLVGLCFNIVAYYPHNVIMAAGRTDSIAKAYWLELLPFLVLVWVLSSNFGAVGAAAAWSVRVIADACILFYLAGKVGGVRNRFSELRYFSLAFAVMVPLVALGVYFQELNIIVCSAALVCTVVYLVLIRQFFLTRDEAAWLSKRFYVIVNREA